MQNLPFSLLLRSPSTPPRRVGWIITSKSGRPCPSSSPGSRWPSAEKAGRVFYFFFFFLNRPLCPPNDPIGWATDPTWPVSAPSPCHIRLLRFSYLVSRCFETSQPQRITSGLNTNFTLSPSYSFHKSSYHKSFFWAYLYSAGTKHGSLHPAGWPILFCGHTQEPCVSHSQHKRNRERFWKKCRWMDWKSRNKQESNPWQ